MTQQHSHEELEEMSNVELFANTQLCSENEEERIMNITLIFYNDKSCRPVNMNVEEHQLDASVGGSRALFRDPDNDALHAIAIVNIEGYVYIWTVDGWTYLGRLTQNPINTEAWDIKEK